MGVRENTAAADADDLIANAYRKLQDSGCRFLRSAKSANWIFSEVRVTGSPASGPMHSRPGDLAASVVRECSSEEVAQDWPWGHSKSPLHKREAWSQRRPSA